jgi:hypothetical protein
VPAWQQGTSPLDSTQKIRRSTSRGAVPSTSSPRTDGWPRTATYHSASSPMRRSSARGCQLWSRRSPRLSRSRRQWLLQGVAIDHHLDVADFILLPYAAFEMRSPLGFATHFAIHIGVDEALGQHGCDQRPHGQSSGLRPTAVRRTMAAATSSVFSGADNEDGAATQTCVLIATRANSSLTGNSQD